MRHILILAGLLSLTACVSTSNKPSDFVVDHSVVKTRIQDPNMERELEYQFATHMEFKTVTRRVGSENAKKCEEFAREYIAMPAWVKICDQAISEQSLSAQNRQATLFNRGLLYMNLDQIELARADFQSIINETPNFGDAYLSLGTIEANVQNYGRAKDYALKALSYEVEQTDRVYVLLGWVAEHQFDFPAAREAYETALKLKPGASATRRKLDRVNRLWPEKAASR